MRCPYRRRLAVQTHATAQQVVCFWLRKQQNEESGLPWKSGAPREVDYQVVPRSIFRKALRLYRLALLINQHILLTTPPVLPQFLVLTQWLRTISENDHQEEQLLGFRTFLLEYADPCYVLDTAIGQVTAEYFGGRGMLFDGMLTELEKRVERATKVVRAFNHLARANGLETIDLSKTSERIRVEVERQVSAWTSIAYECESTEPDGDARSVSSINPRSFLPSKPSTAEVSTSPPRC